MWMEGEVSTWRKLTRIVCLRDFCVIQPTLKLRGCKQRTSPVAQMVERLPTTRETWVQSLGWEGLLEKEMATHSSILTWKIPWTEEPGRLHPMGSQRVRHD